MKKNILILLFTAWSAFVFAQKVNVPVGYTDTPPTIDGVEEGLWDNATKVALEGDFQAEKPTVTAYWKAVWDSTAFYVLLKVEDDDHWPAHETTEGKWWQYDQIEVYFDINESLEDGQGPGAKETGHYQTKPEFMDGADGVPQQLEASTNRPGGTTCYALDGNDYVFELAIDYSSMVNGSGETMSAEKFAALEKIGFDVTIIDQDEGVTTERQRKVWQNLGDTDENWNNMDDAGTIQLVDVVEIEEPKLLPTSAGSDLKIYPNPAVKNFTIDIGTHTVGSLTKVSILNLNGQQVFEYERPINGSPLSFDISNLRAGIYMVDIRASGFSKIERLVVK